MNTLLSTDVVVITCKCCDFNQVAINVELWL